MNKSLTDIDREKVQNTLRKYKEKFGTTPKNLEPFKNIFTNQQQIYARKLIYRLRSNPRITAFQDIEPTEQFYPSIFGDFDKDGILDVDDPNPYDYDPNSGTIEEIKLSDEIRALIVYRQSMEALKNKFLKKLTEMGATRAFGRTKTPFSLVNKLRRKRLSGQFGLSDVVGTTILANDAYHLQILLDKIISGELGVVTQFNDYYAEPKNGYRAFHFILFDGDVPIEIQLKTERQHELGSISHTLYKIGQKDSSKYNKLTYLAHLADMGDPFAIKQYNNLTRDKEALMQKIRKNPPEIEFAEGFNANMTTKGLQEHVKEGLGLPDTFFRLGSKAYLNLYNEIEAYWDQDNVILRGPTKWMVENLEVGTPAIYEGERVFLDVPFRGGRKKFVVYHNSGRKNKDDEIVAKKIEWGDPNLTVKNDQYDRSKSFWRRHGCDGYYKKSGKKTRKMDPSTAGFWACYGPTLFAAQLELQSDMPW